MKRKAPSKKSNSIPRNSQGTEDNPTTEEILHNVHSVQSDDVSISKKQTETQGQTIQEEQKFILPKIVDIVGGESSVSGINEDPKRSIEVTPYCKNAALVLPKSNPQQTLPLKNNNISLTFTHDGQPLLVSGQSGRHAQTFPYAAATTTGINTNGLGWSFPTTTAVPALPLLISSGYQVLNNFTNTTQIETVSATSFPPPPCYITNQIQNDETPANTKNNISVLNKQGEVKCNDEDANKVSVNLKHVKCDLKVKKEEILLHTKNPVVTVQISDDTSVTLQRFYFNRGLCRICLLEKPHTSSIFEDVAVDDKGMVENVRGPHSTRFNIITAIKTVIDVDVAYGDGLPDQICIECWDHLISFSAFRRQISIGQFKLNAIVTQVQSSANPTFIPAIGEQDHLKTDIYRYPESISQAKSILQKSKFSHLVQRCLPDRAWDKIFVGLSQTLGNKSSKVECLEQYIYSAPYVSGWFCRICQCTIHDSKEDYEVHFQTVHTNEKTSTEEIQYPCDICGCYFPTSDKCSLTQNYRSHWLQHFFFHECSLCLKRFPSVKGLTSHKKNSHTGDGKSHRCDTCNKSFKTKSSLDAHKKTHLDPSERKKLNYCEICDKGLAISLALHMQTAHSDERPWKCSICDKHFKRREVLVVHRDTVHLKLKKFKCEICEETFKSSAAKMTHVRRHKGEKPFMCKVCDKSFVSVHSLRSHEVKHQEVGSFKCSECEKIFKRKNYLAEHMRIHTNEKPHECPICGKCIRMKSNYFKHLNVHKRH